MTAGETLTKEPGYVQTTPDEDNTSKQAKQVVYALDCEMSYTTVGLELTRVTVVNMNLQPVYETLVKPRHTIVDYNTRSVCGGVGKGVSQGVSPRGGGVPWGEGCGVCPVGCVLAVGRGCMCPMGRRVWGVSHGEEDVGCVLAVGRMCPMGRGCVPWVEGVSCG